MSDPAPLTTPAPVVPVENVAAEVAAFRETLAGSMPRLWVTAGIVAVCVAVFAAMTATGVDLLFPDAGLLLPWGANYGPRTLGGQPWRLLTQVFLHFGVFHLALNLLVLVIIGRTVERLFGHTRFAALYLVSAITAGLASVVFHPQLASAGASGPILGVYGALAAFLLRRRGAVPASVAKKLVTGAAVFVGLNLTMGMTNSAIDNAAHLGGLLGGALCGAVIAPAILPGVAPQGGTRLSLSALGLTVAVALLVTALLPRPFDYVGAILDFHAAEQRAIGHFNGFVELAHKQQLSDEQFAEGIEQRMLPDWRAAMSRFAAGGPWPKERASYAAAMKTYGETRDRNWSDMVQALRAHDAEAMRGAQGRDAEAIKTLNEQTVGLRSNPFTSR